MLLTYQQNQNNSGILEWTYIFRIYFYIWRTRPTRAWTQMVWAGGGEWYRCETDEASLRLCTKKKKKKLKRLPLAGHDSTDAQQPCSGRGTLLSVWPGMTDFISSIEDFFFFLTVISMFEYTCIYNLDWWMVYANMNWLTSITNTRYDFIMFFFCNLN